MQVVILIILCLYVIRIIRYAFGWSSIKGVLLENFSPKVSVVIAVRNEENVIPRLLKGLQSQLYPTQNLDLIFVNDHSIDNTLSLLEDSKIENLQILNMPEGICGKKQAISMAVSIARGDIILATDADCVFTNNWVSSMVRYFENDDIKLVSGPVNFHNQLGFFQCFQGLEFISLIASGAGAIGINNPIFCNGANMAYRKEVFLKLNAFKDDKLASGDDVFLLHSIKAKYSNSISFSKDEDSIVITEGTQTFMEFLNQRKRWTAKSIEYKDFSSIYVSYLVLFSNLSFVFLFFMIFFDSSFFLYFVFFYMFKFVADLFLLLPVLKFFRRTKLIKWVFPFEFFYSFYIILIIILSLTKKFEWKGRMYNK